MVAHVAAALECHRLCEETITHSLRKSGRYAEAANIQLLTDCSDICRTTGDFMVRGSRFHGRIAEVCAEVCDACADYCVSVGDDEQLARCAAACRECARLCREMAGASA